MLVKVIDPRKEQDYYCNFAQASRLLSVGAATVHQLYPYTLQLKIGSSAGEFVPQTAAPQVPFGACVQINTQQKKVVAHECFDLS